MEYLKLNTREDFYNYVKDDIHFNVFNMADGELDAVKSYCALVNFFYDLQVNFPSSKQRLNIIVHSARQNFEKCLRYILIPDNASADLVLRTLAENLIILKFLVANDVTYIRKWDMWVYNMLPADKMPQDLLKVYKPFASRCQKEYDAVLGSKPEFQQLLENKYGWAFPAVKSGISLKRIAEACSAMDVFDMFGKLSFNIHANTSVQNITSRMEQDAYKIISYAIDIMGEYMIVLMDYIPRARQQSVTFLDSYQQLRTTVSEYFSDVAFELHKRLY